MSLTIKAYILSGRSKTDCQEIRRFTASENTVRNYHGLQDKVCEVFPSLNRTGINLHWKDNDGDLIHFTSNEELAEALRTVVDGVLKVFVQEKSKSQGELHPGVICNNCGTQVRGNRYKCLICHEYELCEDCENLRVHLEHAVIRIPNPTTHWMPLVTVSSGPHSPAMKGIPIPVDFNQSTRCNAAPFDIDEYQPPLQSRPGFAAAMCDPFMHDWSLLSDSPSASLLSQSGGATRIIDHVTKDEDTPRTSGTYQMPKKPMSRSLFDFDDDDEPPKHSKSEVKPNKSEGKLLASTGPKDKKFEEKPLASINPNPKESETAMLSSNVSGNLTLEKHSSPKSNQPMTVEKSFASATFMEFSESLERSYSQSQLISKTSDILDKSRGEIDSTLAASIVNSADIDADISPDNLTLTNLTTSFTQEHSEKKDSATNDISDDTPNVNSNDSNTTVNTGINTTEEYEVDTREENRSNEITSNDTEDIESTADITPATGEDTNQPMPTVDYNLYYPKIRRYAEALDNLLSMGFSNEGGWLSILVEEKRGDIIRVLDFIENNIQKCKENEQAKTRR